MAGARFHDKINMQTQAMAAAARLALRGTEARASGVANGLTGVGRDVARAREREHQIAKDAYDKLSQDAQFNRQMDLRERQFEHSKDQAEAGRDLAERRFQHGREVDGARLDLAHLGAQRQHEDNKLRRDMAIQARSILEAQGNGISNASNGLLAALSNSAPKGDSNAMRFQIESLAAMARQARKHQPATPEQARQLQRKATLLDTQAQRVAIQLDTAEQSREERELRGRRREAINSGMTKALQIMQGRGLPREAYEDIAQTLQSNDTLGRTRSNTANTLVQQWEDRWTQIIGQQKAQRRAEEKALDAAENERASLRQSELQQAARRNEAEEREWKDHLKTARKELVRQLSKEDDWGKYPPQLELFSIDTLKALVPTLSGAAKLEVRKYIVRQSGQDAWIDALALPGEGTDRSDFDLKIDRLNETRRSRGERGLTPEVIEKLRQRQDERESASETGQGLNKDDAVAFDAAMMDSQSR